MKEPISFTIFLIILAWGIYRCCQLKKERYLQGVVAACLFQLHFYPLWLPSEFVFSGFCLLGATGLLYKVYFQKQDKNLLIYVIIFLFLFGLFLSQGIIKLLPK